MRLIIDTNIFVSGIVWHGKPGMIVDSVLINRLDSFLISNEIIDEIEDVIGRHKFKLDKESIESTIKRIKKIGEIITIPAELSVADSGCRDPKDIRYLKCAVAGNADYIISGDKHLREIQTYRGIKIITASEYLNIITASRGITL